MAEKLAAGPGMGLAVTKRMLNAEAHMDLGEAMQAEGWIQAECMKHPDYRESYDAFVKEVEEDIRKNHINIDHYMRDLRKHALIEYNDLYLEE